MAPKAGLLIDLLEHVQVCLRRQPGVQSGRVWFWTCSSPIGNAPAGWRPGGRCSPGG